MDTDQIDENDPRALAALAELQEIIQAVYPTACFKAARGDDPVGLYLHAIVDVEEIDVATAVFLDRLLDMQIEEGLPIYVIPLEPVARVLATLHPLDPVASRAEWPLAVTA
jgi:hypothetical protein